MHKSRRMICALLALSWLATLGCTRQPVRQDRTIAFSSEGKTVGFQHDAEGVFVADRDGGPPKRIFQPEKDVLATSTPLWAPTGKRLVFTTARDPAGPQPPGISWPRGRENPEGRLFTKFPIKYTCLLRDEDADGPDAKPKPLFEAHCDHVGYIAANLAVRWDPRGNRLFYVNDLGGSQQSLFEFDLATKKSRQVLPVVANALLFDWSPDGACLSCMIGTSGPSQPNDGIWVSKVGEQEWWHLPESGQLALPEFYSLLESLRATKPAWTRDGKRFAFASHQPGPQPESPGTHRLKVANVDTQELTTLAESAEPFRDLAWSPDGKRLGVVKGHGTGTLHTVTPGGPLSPPLSQRPVRKFAGWNQAGDRLAYVTPDRLPYASKQPWTFLLWHDDLARDAVFISSGAANDPPQEVFSGMRVTFPLWSPTEDKLSLWFTFSPVCRSWLALFLGTGLRPGDPAAIFDVPTKQINWLAVNGKEKVQIGHYYLLKRQYAEAWKWYAEAERELPAPTQPSLARFITGLQDPAATENFAFFQYYCLTKLGRVEEAKAKLELFQRTYLPKLADPAADQKDADPIDQTVRAIPGVDRLLAPDSLISHLVRNLYIAEVLVSLDAADDAETLFRKNMADEKRAEDRLSSALVLSQILLLQKKHGVYANLVGDALLPSYLEVGATLPGGQQNSFFGERDVLDLVTNLAVAPLFAPDFLAKLSKDELKRFADRLEKIRANAKDAKPALLEDLLYSTYKQLGRDRESAELLTRIKTRTGANGPAFSIREEIAERLPAVREQMNRMFRREW